MQRVIGKAGTFLSFVSQQKREAKRIAGEFTPRDTQSEFHLTGEESDWLNTGRTVQTGEHFRLKVTGFIWVLKGMSVGIPAEQLIWVRIGGAGPFYRVLAEETEFQAWQPGEVELIMKGLSYWADRESGTFLTGPRKADEGGVGVQFTRPTGNASHTGAPEDWRYHWQIGDAQIYTPYAGDHKAESLGALSVDTHGDVGIICKDCVESLTPDTYLSWSWLVEQLPSKLAEDLSATHDYLSMAVEFDNGLDISYIWSAKLPEGYIFQCPLDYWCEYETHWVLRNPQDSLGQWYDEKRNLWDDYAQAIGSERPNKVVRVWLISNSLFQCGRGLAHFKDIEVTSSSAV